MSVDRDANEELEIDVDVEEDTLEIERQTSESVRIDELFQPVNGSTPVDGRLQLWCDSAGWNGYERRGSEFYRVNVLLDTVVDGDHVTVESNYVVKEQVPPSDVAKAVRNHIEDPKAGGDGKFARGCSPP